jgi:hypothetical protein
MIPHQKVELAGLLGEKMFRSEQGVKFELLRKIISGVERTILVVRLKLRPPSTVRRDDDLEKKLELAKLLEYRTRSSFEIRRQGCIAAEMRLGM